MKRIMALIRRDLLSTRKDSMLLYMVVAPLIFALGLRLFLPALGQTGVNVVVTRDMPVTVVEGLSHYLNVERVEDRASLEQRVLAYDDMVGIVPQGDGYTLVLEGNETHDTRALPEVVLHKALGGDGITMTTVEVGQDQVPFREMWGVFIALSVIFISSMVMGFHIIEDKESRMMQALGVSPLSNKEYLSARAISALVLATILVFGCLWIMGLAAFDHLQMLVVVFVTSLVGALAGFSIGALSSNQIVGIANIKFGMLIFILPAILTLLIPESFWVAMYWLPTFWSFVSLKAVLLERAAWTALAPTLAWTLGTSLLLLAVSYPWLRGKLDFGKN